MRIAITLTLAAALAMTACSRANQTQIKEGAQATGADLQAAASTIKNDPDIKQAGTAIKESVVEDSAAIKQAAVAAGDAAKDAAAKTRDATLLAADKTRAAAADAKADIQGK